MTGNDMKIGIHIGDRYGSSNFQTDVKDPVKAIEEANEYIAEKYGRDMRIGIVKDHKRRKGR